jgi:SAM-dependent methyltransferase
MAISSKIYADWMREIQERKIKGILDQVMPEGRILDVGCGAGFLEKHLPNAYAVDIDLENLKKAGAAKVLASGDALPFKSKIFDTIFCINAIRLMRNREIGRVLSSTGRAVASIFCSEYNKQEKLQWLKSEFKNWKIQKEFFVGSGELDAVIVCNRYS